MRLYRHQVRWEQLTFWRSRESAVFVFLFPLLLFALLTAVYNGSIYGHPASWALLAGMLAYGTATTAFAGLALILVARREMGILKRIRSTPLPPTTYLVAVLTSIMVVFALQAASLFILGKVLKSTPWPHHVLSLVLSLALGAAVFAALGLALTGFIRSLEGSSAIVNVIVLPMAFLSGSFGSVAHYPKALRVIGDVLPLKYLLDLINGVYLHGQQIWDRPRAVAVLAAWGLLGMAAAMRKFRWEPREG
ncbi:MAG: type transport system permease protein [Gaiellaceae bacterium]|nr:type transport system permease protein [Gaiellaceae bacterium]